MINEVEEEIETLKAIYLDEFKVGTSPQSFGISSPFKNDMLEITFLFWFDLHPKYPNVAPTLSVLAHHKLTNFAKFIDAQTSGLEDFLRHKASKKLGNVMIYDLIQESSDYIQKFFSPQEIKSYTKSKQPIASKPVNNNVNKKPTLSTVTAPPAPVAYQAPDSTRLPVSVTLQAPVVTRAPVPFRAPPPVLQRTQAPVVKSADELKELLELVCKENWPRFLAVKSGYSVIPDQVFEFGLLLAEIDMSYNSIIGINPKISLIKNLSKLNLTNNNIKFLPVEIGELANLRVLEVAKNSLVELPDSITNLTNLQVLQLEHNKITALPENIGKLVSLQCLDLQYNRIKYIPADIAKLSKLSMLRLRSNPIVSPPPEVYHKGTEAILTYMKSHLGEFIGFGTSSLGGDLGRQLNDKRFSDVQFEISKKIIYAHKCVLETVCEKLAELWKESDYVLITTWSYNAFYEFLLDLYTDIAHYSDHKNEIIEIAIHFEATVLVNRLVTMKEDNETLSQSMVDLWRNPVYSDVSFVSEENEVIYANKVICARSEYFKAMFSFENRSEKLEMSVSSPVLKAGFNKHFSFVLILQVLEFLYTDEIDNSIEECPDMILDLFSTASQFNMPRLKAICESIIGYNVDGVLHNSTPLINVCEYFITAHYKQVRYTEAYQSLDEDAKQHFVKLVKQAVAAINK